MVNNKRKAQTIAMFFVSNLENCQAINCEIKRLTGLVANKAALDNFFDEVSKEEADILMLQWVQEHCIELLNKALEE
jgi:hypothetical protein